MKTEYRWILWIFFSLIALLVLKKPLEFLLLGAGWGETRSDLIAGIADRLLIAALALWLVLRYGFGPVNGLTPRLRIQNYQALLIPFAFVGLVLFSNLDTYRLAEPDLVVLFGVSVLLVGLVEELIFRGMLLPLLIRSGWGVIGSVLISALLFGLIHYLNIFRQPDNLAGVHGQVIIAFCLGGFFGGYFLRMGNILPVALFHALFNFTFGAGVLKGTDSLQETAENSAGLDAGDIGGLVVFGLVLVSGLVLARWTDPEVLREKVKRLKMVRGRSER